MIHSKKMRDSARGEECTLEILGVCSYNTETVVLCHFPDESGVMGSKVDDFCAGYACHTCHTAIDQRGSCPEFDERSEWYLRRSQNRTARRMFETGTIKLK